MEKVWLVKSSNRILGPYDFDEIKKLILDLHVSVIDEVKTPDSRWKFVREHSQLTEVVAQVRRNLLESKEDTTSIYTKNDELTPTPMPKSRAVFETHNRALETSLPIDESPLKSTLPQISQEKNSVLWSAADPTNQKRSSLWVPAVWVLSAVAVIFVVVTVMKSGKPASSFPMLGIGFDEYLGLAKYNQNIGDFAKSLEMYSKAQEIKDLDGNSKIQYAAMLLALQNRTVEVRRLIEEAKKSLQPDPEMIRQMQLLVALSFVKEGRFGEAKTFLLEVKDQDPLRQKVGFNYIALLLRLNEVKPAFDEAQAQNKAASEFFEFNLLKAVAVLRMPEASQSMLQESVQDLQKYTQERKDFLLEALYLKAALEKKLNLNAEMQSSLKQLFDLPLDLTRDHVHDVYLDLDVLGWPSLSGDCQKTSESIEGFLSLALKGYCLLQANQLSLASEVIDKAYFQYSSEPILRTLYALLLARQSRFDEVKSLLRLAITPRQKELITADLCLRDSNWPCSEASWKAVSAMDSEDLYALRGLAMKDVEIGQKSQAEMLVQKGLAISSNFQPLLSLKEKLRGK